MNNDIIDIDSLLDQSMLHLITIHKLIYPNVQIIKTN